MQWHANNLSEKFLKIINKKNLYLIYLPITFMEDNKTLINKLLLERLNKFVKLMMWLYNIYMST